MLNFYLLAFLSLFACCGQLFGNEVEPWRLQDEFDRIVNHNSKTDSRILDNQFSFLCEPYYGKKLTTLKSIRNESIRLTVLAVPPNMSPTFDVAQEICRKCVDGTLVMQDDVTKLSAYLPTWIGIQSKPENKLIKDSSTTSDYIWLDGSAVNRWQRNFAANFFEPTGIQKHHAIYAIKKYPSYFKSSTSSSNMDWISLPKTTASTRIKSVLRNGMYPEAPSRNGYNGYNDPAEEDMKFVVCERPLRNNCHYWNYTEDACLNHPRFGCHSYLNAMYSDADPETVRSSINSTCTPPEHRRYAFKCNCSNCTCHVSEWGEWSSCGSEICSELRTQRSRTRQQIDPLCPDSYRRFELFEYENCRVPGCDELETSFDNCTSL